MTAPKPVDPAEVKATVVRLHRWLRDNGHTAAANAAALVKLVEEHGIEHAKNSPARLVTEGLIVAYGTYSIATRASARRAIAEFRLFRPRLKKLLAALSEMDQDLAARGLEAEEPTYAELGARIARAVNAVSVRLETRDDKKRVPTSRAQWRKFTGNLAHMLRAAGVNWAEIVMLFPHDVEEKPATKERLRKRAARFKVALERARGRKKAGGRPGAPNRPSVP